MPCSVSRLESSASELRVDRREGRRERRKKRTYEGGRARWIEQVHSSVLSVDRLDPSTPSVSRILHIRWVIDPTAGTVTTRPGRRNKGRVGSSLLRRPRRRITLKPGPSCGRSIPIFSVGMTSATYAKVHRQNLLRQSLPPFNKASTPTGLPRAQSIFIPSSRA